MDDRDDAFAAFVAGRSWALHRTAYLLTGDHARAEDLLQSTLLKVYLAWPRIHDPGAVEEYTRRAMVRTQVSFWRRAARRELTVAEPPEPGASRGRSTGWSAGPPTGVGASRIEDRDEVWRALAWLGPRQRAVIVLRFYEDLTEAEIARVLGCAVGTVKSQLSRGLARLQQHLEHPSAHHRDDLSERGRDHPSPQHGERPPTRPVTTPPAGVGDRTGEGM